VALPKLSLADPAPYDPSLSDFISLLNRPAWMAEAACKGEPVEIFIPSRGRSTVEAKAFCSRCPVRSECLAFALDQTELPLGIWGGTSDRERKRLRRGRRCQVAEEIGPPNPRVATVTLLH
jgi:WhiB family redox-sensing transcriptional regulator